MMKKTVCFFLIFISLIACTTNILDEDKVFDDRNVVLNHFFYFNDQVLDTTKIFTLGNARVIFKDVSVAFGGYYFTDHLTDTVVPDFKDTINPYKFDPNIASLKYGTASRIFKLDNGVYQGVHHFKMGLDSSITPQYSEFDSNHPMTREGLYRGENQGFNSLFITGLYKEIGDTASSEPDKIFTYRVSDEILDLWWSKPTSFNVVSNMDINMNIVWNIDELLSGLDPTIIDNIESDPSDAVDILLAESIVNNILVSYQIQL